MEPFDSENYWNRTSSVAFSFDDDDDVATRGDVVGLVPSASTVFNDDTISEASFDNSSSIGVLNLSIKSIISEDALRQLLQEQTLDDRIITKTVSPEEELKLLRRQMQTTLYSPSPEVTAHKLLMGKMAPLEAFRSLQEKQQLLDAVLRQGGGDGIIAIILFLEKTLNRNLFHKILQERPKAFEHYTSYLRQRGDISELIEVLLLFDRQQEAALLQFQAALLDNEPAVRKQKLLRLKERYNSCTSIVSLYQQLFHAAYKLHELVEKEQQNLGGSQFITYQSTPIEALYACCRKHTNWKDQDSMGLSSPQRLAAEQQISAAQYEWTALNERARAQVYADLECIFERVPTWLPLKTKQFHISFTLEVAIQRLYDLEAPASVLYLFLSKMSNNSEKLALAQRVKCIKAQIDAMAGMKQVAQLTQLKDALPARSEEQFYCENALKNLQSKRWTTDTIKLKL